MRKHKGLPMACECCGTYTDVNEKFLCYECNEAIAECKEDFEEYENLLVIDKQAYAELDEFMGGM